MKVELFTPRLILVPIEEKDLDALHKRWVILLRSLTPTDLQKTFFHPEHNKSFRLDATIASYAWHGRHHLGFIQNLKTRMGW